MNGRTNAAGGGEGGLAVTGETLQPPVAYTNVNVTYYDAHGEQQTTSATGSYEVLIHSVLRARCPAMFQLAAAGGLTEVADNSGSGMVSKVYEVTGDFTLQLED